MINIGATQSFLYCLFLINITLEVFWSLYLSVRIQTSSLWYYHWLTFWVPTFPNDRYFSPYEKIDILLITYIYWLFSNFSSSYMYNNSRSSLSSRIVWIGYTMMSVYISTPHTRVLIFSLDWYWESSNNSPWFFIKKCNLIQNQSWLHVTSRFSFTFIWP